MQLASADGRGAGCAWATLWDSAGQTEPLVWVGFVVEGGLKRLIDGEGLGAS